MEEKVIFQKPAVIKNRKGFTLIELMVVVAIIGILALLGLRMYIGQQDKARNSLLRGNIATIHTLIQSELADNSQTGLQIWNRVNDIFVSSGIHVPAGSPQTSNISGMGASEPGFTNNGGRVFVFVNDSSNPTIFYINGVNAEETGFVFQNHLIARK